MTQHCLIICFFRSISFWIRGDTRWPRLKCRQHLGVDTAMSQGERWTVREGTYKVQPYSVVPAWMEARQAWIFCQSVRLKSGRSGSRRKGKCRKMIQNQCEACCCIHGGYYMLIQYPRHQSWKKRCMEEWTVCPVRKSNRYFRYRSHM